MIINAAKAVISRHGSQSAREAAAASGSKLITRQFNFASSQYASCFTEIPTPNVYKFRKDAIEYLERFDGKKWYDDPVRFVIVSIHFIQSYYDKLHLCGSYYSCATEQPILFIASYSNFLYCLFDVIPSFASQIVSILNGEKLPVSKPNLNVTTDSLSKPNGHQYYATPSQVKDLLNHIKTYHSPYQDIRPQIRRIESKFLNEYAGMLIGNQCLDFAKQDGITEMEESVMANSVERKLNDELLKAEQDGKVVIERKAIYVSCVSNFTNFLDLFRKTLRR